MNHKASSFCAPITYALFIEQPIDNAPGKIN